jgi:hypothetical protein
MIFIMTSFSLGLLVATKRARATRVVFEIFLSPDILSNQL